MVSELRLERYRYRSRLWPARRSAHFADLESHKAPDRNIFTELDDRLGDHFADGHALVLDVVLFVKAVFLVELFHFPVDDFFDDRFRLARRQCLRLVDVTLFLEHLRRHFLAPHVARIQRCDVHRDVVRKLLESVRARNEIGLAVQLHQHTDFPAGVNVTSHESFGRFAHSFFCGRSLSFLSQNRDGFFNVAARFHQRGAAIRETGVGPLAQFLDELGWDLYCWLLCTHPFSLCCLAISLLVLLAAKRPAPNRSARASQTFHPRNLFSVFRRPEEQWLPQPRQAPREFRQRPRRSHLPAFRTVRTRWYLRTRRHPRVPGLPRISAPPPAIAGRRCGLQHRVRNLGSEQADGAQRVIVS